MSDEFWIAGNIWLAACIVGEGKWRSLFCWLMGTSLFIASHFLGAKS